jgi:hypothetical protein
LALLDGIATPLALLVLLLLGAEDPAADGEASADGGETSTVEGAASNIIIIACLRFAPAVTSGIATAGASGATNDGGGSTLPVVEGDSGKAN